MGTLGCVPTKHQPDQPSALDYCAEVVELITEFEGLLSQQSHVEDPPRTDELVFAAKRISGLVRRSENEGVDLSAENARWLAELKLAARAFVASTEIDLSGYSDEQKKGLAKGILERLDAARLECASSVS